MSAVVQQSLDEFVEYARREGAGERGVDPRVPADHVAGLGSLRAESVEGGQRGLDGRELTDRVDLELAPQLVERKVFERAHHGDAGVVDQRVQVEVFEVADVPRDVELDRRRGLWGGRARPRVDLPAAV